MNTATLPANVPKPSLGSKIEAMQGILSTYNDVPIDFYGKLVDQFGNPVAGAEIKGSIRVINGVREGTDRFSTTSDAKGLFQFHGRGQDIGMMPRKQGYTIATTDTFFKYSHMEDHPYVSDANNPTVIKMWKLQGAEHLISFGFAAYAPVDGRPVLFDLVAGQRVEPGGDISVSVESSPEPNTREEYDWRVTLRAINGGIIERSGIGLEKMFQAPDSGYQPEFEASYKRGASSWSSSFTGGFYFTTRSGSCYGKCNFRIVTFRVKNGAVPITLSGYLNPAGSRTLEIDPSLVSQAHP
jgi:hypothetical protein